MGPHNARRRLAATWPASRSERPSPLVDGEAPSNSAAVSAASSTGAHTPTRRAVPIRINRKKRNHERPHATCAMRHVHAGNRARDQHHQPAPGSGITKFVPTSSPSPHRESAGIADDTSRRRGRHPRCRCNPHRRRQQPALPNVHQPARREPPRRAENVQPADEYSIHDNTPPHYNPAVPATSHSAAGATPMGRSPEQWPSDAEHPLPAKSNTAAAHLVDHDAQPITVADAYHGVGFMVCPLDAQPVTVTDGYNGVGNAGMYVSSRPSLTSAENRPMAAPMLVVRRASIGGAGADATSRPGFGAPSERYRPAVWRRRCEAGRSPSDTSNICHTQQPWTGRTAESGRALLPGGYDQLERVTGRESADGAAGCPTVHTCPHTEFALAASRTPLAGRTPRVHRERDGYVGAAAAARASATMATIAWRTCVAGRALLREPEPDRGPTGRADGDHVEAVAVDADMAASVVSGRRRR